MKRFITILSMSALVLAASCEKPAQNNENSYDSDFNAGQFYGLYYGTEYTPELANYFFYLTDKEGIIDAKRQPDCTFYEIDLYSSSIIGQDEPITLPVGTFELSTEPSDNVFTGISYSTAASENSGSITLTDIASFKEGSIKIEKEGDQYAIELIVTLESEETEINGLTHHITYRGPAPFIDMRQPSIPSTETKFTSAKVTSYIPENEIGWGFDQIYVYFSDMEADMRNGYEAFVVLNTEPMSEDDNTIPDGTYPMATTGSVPDTFNPGLLHPITGEPTGTYIISHDKNGSGTAIMATGGEITLTSKNGITTVTMELVLGESTFSATYTGELPVK